MLNRRLMAAVLAGVMAVSTLGGCSGGQKTKETTASQTTAAAVGGQTETEAAQTEAGEDGPDWGTINGKPISDEPITIRIFAATGADVGNYADFEYMKKHCEANNINVEWECYNLDMVDDRLNVICLLYTSRCV